MLNKKSIIARLKNQDLAFDIERILSMDLPIVISKEYDANLDNPFILDIEDNSYFYANEVECNSDYLNLYSMLRPLGYDFVNNDVNGFTLYTTDEFNNVYETDLQPYDDCEVISYKIENTSHSYFYVSGCSKDVLEAIKNEQEVANQINLELVCILPSCTFIAIY